MLIKGKTWILKKESKYFVKVSKVNWVSLNYSNYNQRNYFNNKNKNKVHELI